MLTKQNFSYLRDCLTDFYRQKIQNCQAESIHKQALQDLIFIHPQGNMTPFKQLCAKLGLTEVQFAERFLNPWQELSTEDIQEVSKYWNWAHSPRKSLLMQISPIDEHKALHWTFINVFELNLPGLELFLPEYEIELKKHNQGHMDLITQMYIAPPYSLPYKQCHYCGRLEKDSRQHEFGKRQLKYCHLSHCPSDPSSSLHIQCCYGNWKRLKTNLQKKLKRANQDADKIKELFLEFCESRYLENLKVQSPVRFKTEKRQDWKLLFTDIHSGNFAEKLD